MNRCACVVRSLVLLSLAVSYTIHAFATQSTPIRLPLVFEPNRGQSPADVRYLFRGGPLAGEFRVDGVSLTLRAGTHAAAQVRMRLVGTSKDPGLDGIEVLPGHTNYLLGNDPAHWLRGLPNYAQVRYREIYSGTDLVFYGNGGRLEHDFEVKPGADPASIAFQLDGAENVALDKKGDLRIKLVDGEITFERPIAYQTVAGLRRSVDAAFTLGDDGSIRFRLGNYDRREKLVIDPVLSFSTYLSPQPSAANLIATDASGNNYVSGTGTFSFPVTSGAFAGCTSCTTNSVVTFISKLSADGTNLLYSTVLGGNSFAQPTGIAVDANGNAVVSGWTGASDFPTKNGQPIATQNNNSVGFLVSLSPDGSSLNYGTLLGSSPSSSQSTMTYATAVALDPTGNAYVTGETGNGFPTTTGALNQGGGGTFGNQFNIYLVKFSPNGTLIYSAVLGTADPQNGGGGPIGASAIAVDAAGDAYVAGQAGTLWPISSNAYLKQIAGSMPYATPFVTKVAPDATSLLYSTYLDYAYVVTGIAALSNGDVFVTGNSVGTSYPTTPDAYQQNSGGGNAFLTELNSTGSALVYSTVIGDSSYTIHGLALDPDGDIWLAAQTSNPQFPLVNPIQGTFPGANGFSQSTSVLNQFDPTGQTLKFSTFLGGNAGGYASSVAIDTNHLAHVAGAAQYGMYTTPGAYDGSVPTPGPGLSGATYAYVALVDPSIPSGTLCLNASTSSGLSFGYLLPQTTQPLSVPVSNCGNAPLTISSIASSNAAFSVPPGSNGCTGSIVAGGSCTVVVDFTPTAAQTYTGQLTFTSNASIPTTTIPLSGTGAQPVASISSQVTFQPLLVGQTSSALFVTLSNDGFVPMTIGSSQVVVTGDFALAPGGTCTTSLPANSSCIFWVTFTPAAAGIRTGTLSVQTSDPLNPVVSSSLSGTAYAAYPVPTIASLVNPSYPINSGTAPITAYVIGTNFFPASVVYVNGVAQPTTYQNSTYLTFSLDPTLVNAVGQIPVTVVNPAPGGGASAAFPLIGYLSIPLTASALTVDPVGGLLYAAIPASATQNPSTVIPINPATGAMMTPIAVSSNPRALAVSDDGSELYVASTGLLQRFNLKTLALERAFSLPVDPEWGQTYVQEMHVVPGSPQSIVVELFANVDPAQDGAALYNDSGLVNWIPGQSVVNSANTIFWLSSFTFTSSPSMIYGLPGNSAFFSEVQVSPTGLSLSGSASGQINQQTGSIVRSDGTLLYTNSGEVWDPATQKLLGTYLASTGSQLFYTAGVVPDVANGHTYFLDTDASYYEYVGLSIDVYDQASYALLGTVPFLGVNSSDAVDLVRWGTNGFAFRVTDTTGFQPSANAIVIVTSNLIGSTSAAPVPILTSVSPTSVNAGGPAFSIQLIGSGFTTASTVLVDGNPRVTTYVSSTSLTAQIPASDIATAGQLNVQVTTPAPGGGTSNFVVVSITPTVKTTPIVTVTPSATSITTAQPLSVTVTVSGGSGAPTPTGTVTLTSGSYASSAATLVGGSATINIPAGSLAVGADPLTITYTPDTASSSTYSNSIGSNSVTVTAPAKTTPTVTLAPSATSITTLQPLSVTVTVSGGSGAPTPTGTVTLTSGSYASSAATLVAGGATINIPAGSLVLGVNSLLVTYLPDSASSSAYNSATGSSTVTVATPIGTTVPTITLKPSSGTITNAQSVAVEVTLAGPNGQSTPTGTVTLSSGSYSAQQILSSGAANFSFAAGTLAAGIITLTASYAGDASYAAASGTTTVTVSQVTISVPAPSPLSPGNSAKTTVTLAAGSNYSGTMNLTCTLTSSPMGAVSLPTCSLNPSSIAIASAGSGTTSLTINTTAASGVAALRPARPNLWGEGSALLAVVLIFGMPSRRRRSWLLLALVGLAVAGATIGCGGSANGGGGNTTPQSTPATTAGNYTFTVTGTDSENATITSSASVTLTVQ